MALTEITALEDKIQYQIIGYISVSLINYENDEQAQISFGSVVELNGKLFHSQSNQAIEGWGPIPDSTLTFITIDSVGDSNYSVTPPTWNTEKQGWYIGTTRYIGQTYKTDFNTYAHKRLYPNRVLGYNANLQIYNSSSNVEILLLETTTGEGTSSSASFKILKPVMGYLWTNDVGALDHHIDIEIYQNSIWGKSREYRPANAISFSNTPYGITLNPGIYRLYSENAGGIATLQNKLFISSGYGSEIVSILRMVQL